MAATYKFGDWLVEPDLNRVRQVVDERALEPQAMNVLVYLLDRSDTTVSVEEILAEVWNGRIVESTAVARTINQIRRALGDSARSPRYIETIARRGYRTVAPVEPVYGSGNGPTRSADDGGPPADAGRNASRLTTGSRVVPAIVVGLLVALAAVLYLTWPRDGRSVAVLPFEDISPGGDQAYLGSGIADELRLELQRLDGLRVASRTSSIAYAQEDSRTIGEILNVDSIIEGSVRKEGDDIRITAQLTDAVEGFAIWSESYSRKLENIFEMQEEIAASATGALGVRLGVGTVNAFRGAGTRNVEAYELYLRTQTYDWSKVAVDRKIRMLERAVELDPNYAAAWSFLGGLKLSTAWDVGPNQVSPIIDRAYPLVLRGVQLDPESATAHSNLAFARHTRFDWIGAEQSYRRAMELRLDRLIVERYASMLMRSGRTEDALNQYGIAEALDPPGVRPPGQAWHAKVAQRRYAEAKEISDWQSGADIIENNLDMAFNDADPEKLKAAIRAIPKTDIAFVALYATVLAEFDAPEEILSAVRDAYRDQGLQWIRKLHDLAMVAAYFGEPRFALQVKGEEVRANVLRISSLWYPVMSEVRRLPEFKKLVTDLNLLEFWRAYGWADACRPLGDVDFGCS